MTEPISSVPPANTGATAIGPITARAPNTAMSDTINNIPAAVPGSLHALILDQLDEDQAQDLVSIPIRARQRQSAALIRNGQPAMPARRLATK